MTSHKITIGDSEIIALTDAPLEFPWSMVFPDIAKADREAYRDLYPASYGEKAFRTASGGYAIRHGGKTVLVDTGFGPDPIDILGGVEGHLLKDMAARGVSPESIDIVIHTHLHLDHIGWNISGGRPTFPNATYYAPEEDLVYFEANLDIHPHVRDQVLPLREMNLLHTYGPETEIAPGITTVATPGHTPGHHSVLIVSRGEKAMVMGDVAHHPMQIDHPEWTPAFEVDPALSAETRIKAVHRLEDENIIAGFCHFPGDRIGHVVRESDRRILKPL
jgi:glyoxylase-like metal-dependent hydrolase (beta-lactamase superfamily II)